MAKPAGRRPKKPNKNFPLFPHADGTWKPTKPIDGKRPSFGSWVKDPKGVFAKQRYDAAMEARTNGSDTPRPVPGTVSVEELFAGVLLIVERKMDGGGIESRSYQDYRNPLRDFAVIVGPRRPADALTPDDFARVRANWAGRYGPHRLTTMISNTRTAFTLGVKNGLLSRQPWYGTEFEKPPRKAKRRTARESEAEHGKRVFSRAEVRAMLDAAPSPLKAMVLLGLNCGFLSVDCARLRKDAVDLDGGFLEFVRQKTETYRAAVLWPETVAAIKEAIADRPDPKDLADDGLVFLTRNGIPYVHDKVHRTEKDGVTKVTRSDAIGQALARLLRPAPEGDNPKDKTGKRGLGIRRGRCGFSALRKTFRTAADEAGDRNAVLVNMGHSFPGMDEWYVRSFAQPRLKAVADHVRKTLILGDPAGSAPTCEPAPVAPPDGC